jgi:hypothetical protein
MIQKRFEDARGMFITQGWKDLMETLQEHHDSITIDRVTTIEDLHYQKGRLEIIRLMLNYDEQVRHQEVDQEQN